MKAIGQNTLNKAGCGIPGCTDDHSELVLHGRCHPRSATWATYDKLTGTLMVQCSECKNPIVLLAVAKEDAIFEEVVKTHQ